MNSTKVEYFDIDQSFYKKAKTAENA